MNSNGTFPASPERLDHSNPHSSLSPSRSSFSSSSSFSSASSISHRFYLVPRSHPPPVLRPRRLLSHFSSIDYRPLPSLLSDAPRCHRHRSMSTDPSNRLQHVPVTHFYRTRFCRLRLSTGAQLFNPQLPSLYTNGTIASSGSTSTRPFSLSSYPDTSTRKARRTSAICA